jgi:hypothetical protein
MWLGLWTSSLTYENNLDLNLSICTTLFLLCTLFMECTVGILQYTLVWFLLLHTKVWVIGWKMQFVTYNVGFWCYILWVDIQWAFTSLSPLFSCWFFHMYCDPQWVPKIQCHHITMTYFKCKILWHKIIVVQMSHCVGFCCHCVGYCCHC